MEIKNSSAIKKILLKISGESLKSSDGSDIFDKTTIFNIIKQIQELYDEQYQLAIVIGGGNIYRGKIANQIELDNQTGDYMGMVATIINGIALRKIIKNHGMNCELFSSLYIPNVAFPINYELMQEKFKNNILIFTGGTGEPNFSTDSCAALRALELQCDVLLFGKNGVDGVYDADPNKVNNAKFYRNISYKEIIQKELQVMDQTALTLCKNSNLELRVFNIQKQNSIIDTLHEKIVFTKIKD